MRALHTTVIHENPLPQLRSRHSFFPSLCRLSDGRLAAAVVIGQAFESVDSHSCICFSNDDGVTWSDPKPMLDKSGFPWPVTDYCKLTALEDGRLLAFGYAFPRPDEEKPLGNPETGGLLEDFIFYALSRDHGESWDQIQTVPCAWGLHAEASAPVTVLADGTWVSPITGFADWEGNMTGPMCGRLLRSEDQGKTWQDAAVCMDFGRPVTCFEQRLCLLEDGTLVCIGWNEDTATGQRLCNHYTASFDGGKTWTKPESTGVMGQASSLCALGGQRFLAIHAVRRNTDRPGIYGYVVDFSQRSWNVVEQALLWAPAMPVTQDKHMAQIFSFLKFGQPSAMVLDDEKLLLCHWFAQDGQYKTVATQIEL